MLPREKFKDWTQDLLGFKNLAGLIASCGWRDSTISTTAIILNFPRSDETPKVFFNNFRSYAVETLILLFTMS
jgi:hypothetical protein